MLMEEVLLSENTEQHPRLLERLFPWTQRNVAKVSPNTKYKELIQQKQTNPIQPATVQKTNVVKPEELKPKKPDPVKSTKDEPIINKQEPVVNRQEPFVNRPKYTPPENPPRTSVFEMWNVIESVGIKRGMLDKVFTTDEAVTELYGLIENRIHYHREQEMITRLKAHVEKMKGRSNLIKA